MYFEVPLTSKISPYSDNITLSEITFVDAAYVVETDPSFELNMTNVKGLVAPPVPIAATS